LELAPADLAQAQHRLRVRLTREARGLPALRSVRSFDTLGKLIALSNDGALGLVSRPLPGEGNTIQREVRVVDTATGAAAGPPVIVTWRRVANSASTESNVLTLSPDGRRLLVNLEGAHFLRFRARFRLFDLTSGQPIGEPIEVPPSDSSISEGFSASGR